MTEVASQRVLLHGLVVETNMPVAARPSIASPQVCCSTDNGVLRSDNSNSGTVLAQDLVAGVVTMRVMTNGFGYFIEWPGFMRATLDRASRSAAFELGFSVSDPRSAAVAPVMLSPAVGVVSMLNGAIVLHTSAVVVRGRAVLLLADRGGGKSSIAALLGSAGVPLLAEDVCALTIDSLGTLVAHSGIHELRLRTTTPWLADLHGLVRSAPHFDGRIVVRPPVASQAVVPVSAILVVRLSHSAKRVTMERIPVAQSVRVLMTSQRCSPILTNSLALSMFNSAVDCVDRAVTSILNVPWAEHRRNRELGLELAEAISASIP